MISRTTRIVLGLTGAVVLIAAAAYLACRNPIGFANGGVFAVLHNLPGYERFARSKLDGEIVRVEYQPYPLVPLVSIEHPDMIAKVREWLLAGEKPGLVPLLGAHCELRIIMSGGREVQLRISMTDYPPYNKPEYMDKYSFAVIEWGPYSRIGRGQPFSDILTDLGLRPGYPPRERRSRLKGD